jgi:hypothetical protein
MNSILAALMVEVALLTYRGASKGSNAGNPLPPFPVPATYVGAFVVFGALSILPGRAQTPANVFAWGLVLATGLNFYTETGAPRFAQAPLTVIAPDTVKVPVTSGG